MVLKYVFSMFYQSLLLFNEILTAEGGCDACIIAVCLPPLKNKTRRTHYQLPGGGLAQHV